MVGYVETSVTCNQQPTKPQTTMNQYTVASYWASQRVNRRGQCAAKAGSFFFEGPTIYSWGHHWPIATIRTLEDTGERVVLYHDVYYSSSTSRHASGAYRAAHRAHFDIHHVEHDFWDDVTDHASLDHAIVASKKAAAERAEEKRTARNNQARRNREHRVCMMRQELERVLSVDLDDMSDSMIERITRECHLWQARRRWNKPVADTGMISFLTTLFEERPELVKDSRELNKILNAYHSLAA